jgi:hypothetical protein
MESTPISKATQFCVNSFFNIFFVNIRKRALGLFSIESKSMSYTSSLAI